MGKKSKKKAKAGVTSPPALTGGTGTALAIGGKASATKNARCFECYRTVKTSEGKGHQCPGCLQIYCWMCEEKQFGTCPNGSGCVHPCRRCENCASGESMFKAMKELGITCEILAAGDPTGATKPIVSFECVDAFCDAVTTTDQFTHDIMPMQMCRNQAYGLCSRAECFFCLNDKKNRSLRQCVGCRVVKCFQCGNLDKESQNRMDTAVAKICVDKDWQMTADDLRGAYEDVKPGTFLGCVDCRQTNWCTECASDRMIQCIAKVINALGRGTTYQDIPLVCDACYYAKKPCTNPTCPNPVGVPTKRCGGCHISRYCSKECQAVDFADHMEKCERMQQKLESKAGRKMNK